MKTQATKRMEDLVGKMVRTFDVDAVEVSALVCGDSLNVCIEYRAPGEIEELARNMAARGFTARWYPEDKVDGLHSAVTFTYNLN